MEFRNPKLITGYFARLDYVSFLSEELGFSIDKDKTSINNYLLYFGIILNHILNLACTIADAGALGAILWTFEIREIGSEIFEIITGARLHINLAFITVIINTKNDQTYNLISSIELFQYASTACRISKNRLLNNFIITIFSSESSATSGWLTWCTGLIMAENKQNYINFSGGLYSDSLTRHFGRLMQIWILLWFTS